MAWTYGMNTLNPGESQRWWLWWPVYPGLELIGAAPSGPAGEIQYTTPGVETNADGSTSYFLTVTNLGSSPAQYSFTGNTGADWSYGDNTLAAGQSQRWWLWWAGYPGVEIIGVQCITPGGVNAGAKMHRLAGAKIHQRCWQEGPRTGGLFIRHQACVGLSAAVSELAGRERRLL
jgi:hypothetical protein